MESIQDSPLVSEDKFRGVMSFSPQDFDDEGRLIESLEDQDDDHPRQRADIADRSSEEPDPETHQDVSSSQSPKKKKEKDRASDKRISDLLYRIKMQDAARAEEQRRYQEDQISRYKSIQSLEEENKLLKGNKLEIEREQILNGLRAAKDAQDVDIEVALQDRLTQISAAQLRMRDEHDKNDQEDYFYSQPVIGDYANSALYDSHQGAEPSYESENFSQWLEKNAWANPKSRSYSRELDMEMHQISEDLDKTLRFNGKDDLIGSPEYFDSLSYAMQQRYGVPPAKEEPRQQQAPAAPPRYAGGVTPVSKPGSSMAEQYVSQNPHLRDYTSVLSKAEIEMYRNTIIPISPGKTLSGDAAVRFMAERKAGRKMNLTHNGRMSQLTLD